MKGVSQLDRLTRPREGKPVDAPCLWCKRKAAEGEVYGVGAEDWDYLNICPACWDREMKEVEL